MQDEAVEKHHESINNKVLRSRWLRRFIQDSPNTQFGCYHVLPASSSVAMHQSTREEPHFNPTVSAPTTSLNTKHEELQQSPAPKTLAQRRLPWNLGELPTVGKARCRSNKTGNESR
jgi:hypothetical protein